MPLVARVALYRREAVVEFAAPLTSVILDFLLLVTRLTHALARLIKPVTLFDQTALAHPFLAMVTCDAIRAVKAAALLYRWRILRIKTSFVIGWITHETDRSYIIWFFIIDLTFVTYLSTFITYFALFTLLALPLGPRTHWQSLDKFGNESLWFIFCFIGVFCRKALCVEHNLARATLEDVVGGCRIYTSFKTNEALFWGNLRLWRLLSRTCNFSILLFWYTFCQLDLI